MKSQGKGNFSWVLLTYHVARLFEIKENFSLQNFHSLSNWEVQGVFPTTPNDTVETICLQKWIILLHYYYGIILIQILKNEVSLTPAIIKKNVFFYLE